MSESKINTMINYLPKTVENFPVSDEKFLFFFEPINIEEEQFLLGFSLKTGVQIFSIITIIQAFNSFLDIFIPYSFWLFLISIFAFIFQFLIAFYAFYSTIKNNYLYAKVGYIIISGLFLIETIYYLSKSVLKIIEFVTPWANDFLRLDFLIYIFGYGVFLFIYLYFIYILYRYMLELKKNNVHLNDEELNNLNIKNENSIE